MNNLENINLGERVRLTSKGYWANEKQQVWINEGVRLDNDQPVIVHLFHPKLDDQTIEKAIRSTEAKVGVIKLYSGAQKINDKTIPYAIFEVSPKPIRKDDIKPKEITPTKPEHGKPEGTKIPVWLFVTVLVFALLLLCILTAIIGIPIIQTITQTPTP